jgi:hypothetical protein
MRLSWDKNVKVNKMQCHKLIHNKLSSVFTDIFSTLRLSKVELGIDLFGGCFNFRVENAN